MLAAAPVAGPVGRFPASSGVEAGASGIAEQDEAGSDASSVATSSYRAAQRRTAASNAAPGGSQAAASLGPAPGRPRAGTQTRPAVSAAGGSTPSARSAARLPSGRSAKLDATGAAWLFQTLNVRATAGSGAAKDGDSAVVSGSGLASILGHSAGLPQGEVARTGTGCGSGDDDGAGLEAGSGRESEGEEEAEEAEEAEEDEAAKDRRALDEGEEQSLRRETSARGGTPDAAKNARPVQATGSVALVWVLQCRGGSVAAPLAALQSRRADSTSLGVMAVNRRMTAALRARQLLIGPLADAGKAGMATAVGPAAGASQAGTLVVRLPPLNGRGDSIEIHAVQRSRSDGMAVDRAAHMTTLAGARSVAWAARGLRGWVAAAPGPSASASMPPSMAVQLGRSWLGMWSIAFPVPADEYTRASRRRPESPLQRPQRPLSRPPSPRRTRTA
ncbi:hypothetical protein FNF28_03983 [Cafeteria roenbergensis]|uniref:Uncharacterized protein n=1 Tax=Cafeteria roenbergensis TaxID=33653 RepID=A0A5A8DJ23_CAFRO|nr:hypothetical protein FNF28_03983 [Cafeteria roenbergensis]